MKKPTGHGFGLSIIGGLMVECWAIVLAVWINLNYIMNNPEFFNSVLTPTVVESENEFQAMIAELILSFIMPTVSIEIGIVILIPQLFLAVAAFVFALIFSIIYLTKIIQ